MDENEKLAVCPFCGSEERKPALVQFGALTHVMCQNLVCGAIGPGRFTPSRAAAAWNRRLPQAAREAAYGSLVEKLRGDALAGDLFGGLE